MRLSIYLCLYTAATKIDQGIVLYVVEEVMHLPRQLDYVRELQL